MRHHPGTACVTIAVDGLSVCTHSGRATGESDVVAPKQNCAYASGFLRCQSKVDASPPAVIQSSTCTWRLWCITAPPMCTAGPKAVYPRRWIGHPIARGQSHNLTRPRTESPLNSCAPHRVMSPTLESAPFFDFKCAPRACHCP